MNKLKEFDAYAKPLDDFKVKTNSGAIISLTSMFTILILIIAEYLDYRTVHIVPELIVDNTRRERLKINVNMTFASIPCNLLNMDVMDVAGEQQNDLRKTMHKHRLDQWGNPIGVVETEHNHEEEHFVNQKGGPDEETAVGEACGDCYGAKPPPSGCCNTCEEVRAAYARMNWSVGNYSNIKQCVAEGWNQDADFGKHEGCLIYGSVDVNKVSGNFHFAPGKSYQHQSYHVHDIQSIADHLKDFHFTHSINSLSFGDAYPGMRNPLDGYYKEAKDKGTVFFQYYIKVVPTRIKYLNGTELSTNQFAVTEYEKPPTENSIPGIFFSYDISPMMVIYTETKQSFSSFLTEVCAITGGIFAVARLLDTFIYSAERTLAKKIELGKLN